MSTKYCKKCLTDKPSIEFSTFFRKGCSEPSLHNLCRVCAAQGAREWYANNKERAQIRMRIYTAARREEQPEVSVSKRKCGRPKKLPIDGKLICATCKQNLPETDFTKDNSKPCGRTRSCKVCYNTEQRKRYHEDVDYHERVRKRTSVWSKANRLAIKLDKEGK